MTNDCYANFEEDVDDPKEKIVTVPQSLDMVIRADFAKYMIDQRATIVPSNTNIDKTGYILTPALPSFIPRLQASLVNRVLIRANLNTNMSRNKSITKPFVRLEVEITRLNQDKLYFTVLFEDSLLKFLPQDPACYSTLYASFASTSLDKFLFIQFASINLQIRTLLLSRDQDLRRIFTEKSFFAFSSSAPPAGWIEQNDFEINQTFGVSLVKSSIQDGCIITVRDVQRNQFFEKENYMQLSLEFQDHSGITSVYLYCHATNVANILSIFTVSSDTQVACIKADSSYILDINGEQLSVIEINALEEIPINILRSNTFIIKKEIQLCFNKNEFFITKPRTIEEPVNNINGVPPAVEIPCPFPSCKFLVLDRSTSQTYNHLLNHFLDSHKDFSKVIMNQLRRHQAKKVAKQNSCPFDGCDFQSWNLKLLERHYGAVHKIGQIVFLQFSLANKWRIEAFKMIGFISTFISSLVQCSHCFEVMTRQQLAAHVASLRKN